MTQYNPKVFVILKVLSILGMFKSFKVFSHLDGFEILWLF